MKSDTNITSRKALSPTTAYEKTPAQQNSKAKQTASPTRNHGILRQNIQEALISDIFVGKIKAGQQLFTQELAIRFGVSHTPIREALIALAAIGLIDLVPNRTAVVRGVTPREVREVLQVRRALECEAVRLTCGRIPSRTLENLSQKFKKLLEAKQTRPARLAERARALDTQLHDLISDSCGNRLLSSELNRLKILFRAFRDASWSEYEARNDYHRIKTEAEEHREIVESLLAGNRSAAAKAMSRHLRNGFLNWTRVLPEPPTDG